MLSALEYFTAKYNITRPDENGYCQTPCSQCPLHSLHKKYGYEECATIEARHPFEAVEAMENFINNAKQYKFSVDVVTALIPLSEDEVKKKLMEIITEGREGVGELYFDIENIR